VRVCVLGRGKVGRVLSRELERAGVDVTLARGRSLPRAQRRADIYLLAVPDASLRGVAEALAPTLDRRAVVLHCAGARGVDELAPLSARGLAVGVFHPLVSFASARAELELTRATFTTFGDPRAVRAARRLAKLFGARCTTLAAPGPAYHAAAALVANGATSLADLGARILVRLGFEQRAAEHAIAGLLASVASNVAHVGLPDALTGPVVRGDAATISRHLEALSELEPALLEAYRTLQPLVLESARRAGLDASGARRVREALARARRAAQVVK
jgi:predicted short-subunit dehydrogenase-like oxidoreductase (DUF2520 family)